MTKSWLVLEIFAVFILAMCRIWFWTEWPLSLLTAVPIILATASWYFRGDNLKTLGINPEWPSKKLGLTMFLIFAAFWLIVLAGGMIWNSDSHFFERASQGVFWYKYVKMSLEYFFLGIGPATLDVRLFCEPVSSCIQQ